jgi:hypothetical protein
MLPRFAGGLTLAAVIAPPPAEIELQSKVIAK